MSRQLRILATVALSSALLVINAHPAAAVTYKASLTTPAGFSGAFLQGIFGDNIVGQGFIPPPTYGYNAFLRNNATNSVVNLNPGADWNSVAYGASADSQVGWGNTLTSPDNHALLWRGTAGSFVDLNPAGFNGSEAYGVSGTAQVGGGSPNSSNSGRHALLWRGSAASVVDLHPSGYAGSVANAISGDNIVGVARKPNSGDYDQAVLWTGPAHTFETLHPAGFAASFAAGVSQDSQVGTAYVSSPFGGDRHAFLWRGTASSAVDLNPVGFNRSQAFGVAGALQVGFGQGIATGGQDHALLWQATATSVFDLHTLLTGLGPQFVRSEARAIGANGVIVGYASDGNTSYAVQWTPVPEPASMALVSIGLIAIAGLTRYSRR